MSTANDLFHGVKNGKKFRTKSSIAAINVGSKVNRKVAPTKKATNSLKINKLVAFFVDNMML